MKKLFLCLVLLACSSKEQAQEKAAPPVPPPAAGVRRLELTVTEKGYEPSLANVKAGEPLEIVVTRKTDKTCAREIIIEDYGVNAKLPLNKPVLVALTPKAPGEIKYGCHMDKMISGTLVAE